MTDQSSDQSKAGLENDLRARFGTDLTREDFTPERIAMYRAYVAQAGGAFKFLTEEERVQSRERFLAAHPADADLWVFGYGSLMWNPAIDVAESLAARIVGYDRAFCLTIAFGRATPQRPGLMLAAVPGSGCHGIAHRIAADKVASETNILWMREMLSGAYVPEWADLTFSDGRTVRGFTFVASPGHPRIEAGLGLDVIAHRIAQAEGDRGTNRDYLFNTQQSLAAQGLSDPYITELDAAVRAIVAKN